jgi:hypothetical protein
MRDSVYRIDQDRKEHNLPTSTAEEFSGYIWADTTKEQPVKDQDDGMDAMRYVVAELDLGARPRIRWMGGDDGWPV